MFISSLDYIIESSAEKKHTSINQLHISLLIASIENDNSKMANRVPVRTCLRFAYVLHANVCPLPTAPLQKLYELIYRFRSATNDTNRSKPRILQDNSELVLA